MKKYLKTMMVFSLAGAFVFTSLFCCCLTGHAQAKEEIKVPACHQSEPSKTSQESSRQDHIDCDCPQMTGLVSLKTIHSFELAQTGLASDQPLQYPSAFIFVSVEPYQALPKIFKDSIPIYLQYSVLRI